MAHRFQKVYFIIVQKKKFTPTFNIKQFQKVKIVPRIKVTTSNFIIWLKHSIRLLECYRLQTKQQKKRILIYQEKYAKDLLKRFNMDKAKSINTPMHPFQVLEADEEGEKVSEKLFRGMIGSLIYLIASRPDLQLSVWVCVRFQANPK